MNRKRFYSIRYICIATLAMLFFWPAASKAQEDVQIEPRILIVFDTSGSMAFDVAGNHTNGDGSMDPWTGGRTCCPGTGGSRMHIAKEAMRQMILASGDIEFGLLKFSQFYYPAQSNAQETTYVSDGNTDDYIYARNQSATGSDELRYHGRQNADGYDFEEYNRDEWLVVPFYEGNSLEILMWMDHHEYSDGSSGHPALGEVDNAPDPLWADGFEQELRADGATPLGESIRATRIYIDSVMSSDAVSTCRPYSVILLTDGDPTPGTLAPAGEVTDLYGLSVDTWVVGLAHSSTTLDTMATNGGGHYDPNQSGDHAFLADSQDSLSTILYQIVEGSILRETCNGADDDCDGETDEGVTNACGNCDPIPEEICDGVDNDCDGVTDEELAQAGSTCHIVPGDPGECGPGAWVCNGSEGWECQGGGPTAEYCDLKDNDCDGVTDNDVVDNGIEECGSYGSGQGECQAGHMYCDQVTNGQWVCRDAVEAEPENQGGRECDRLDNDCDGATDEGITQDCDLNPNGAADEGICEHATRYCKTLDAYNADPSAGPWTDCVGGIEPSPQEVCNGLDDDCDGETDESIPGTGVDAYCQGSNPNGCYAEDGGICPDGNNQGECNAGHLECINDSGAYSIQCVDGTSPISNPTPEGAVCDGLDNDCDGLTDENIREACGGCDTDMYPDYDCLSGIVEGECATGWRYCSGTSADWGACDGDRGPIDEICDGMDNDCDGTSDETPIEGVGDNCGGGTTTTDPNEGECQQGTLTCEGGVIACDGGQTPVGEGDVCDGLDNDCDGLTDEMITEPCGGSEFGDYNDSPSICRIGFKYCTSDTCLGGVDALDQEICNGIDDDCNGTVDDTDSMLNYGDSCETGFCTGSLLCVIGRLECDGPDPSEEECNGVDDDCDGATDEGLFRDCGAGINTGICHDGVQRCVGNDVWSDCEGEITTREELCNGLDDDCDGATDEDPLSGVVGNVCNQCGDLWQCVDGGLHCDTANSQPEECDGIDNDCDGLTDELTNPCGGCDGSGSINTSCNGPDGASEGQCRQGVQHCDSASASEGNPVWFEDCVGSIGPNSEVCDGFDNDCDGLSDEDEDIPLVGKECRRAIGLCEAATLRCVSDQEGGSELECCHDVDTDGACIPPQGPDMEFCNGYDDNCNGITDENLTLSCGGCDPNTNPGFSCPAGANEGACQQGVRLCNSTTNSGIESWSDCQGSEDPADELCNLIDDDCDGDTDESILFDPPSCSQSGTGNSTEGICTPGQWICVNGNPNCDGGQGPLPETCNALDDDCDGETDENLEEAGVTCGKSIGICEAGLTECVCDPGGENCDIECVGETSGTEEVCNGLDDDCDGLTDEDLPLGATCTNAPNGENPEGECNEGNLQCIEGEWNCNANSPTPEICDGLDNDCDGLTDENLAVECPGESLCIQGNCAEPCAGAELSCPSGKACTDLEENGKDYRVCLTDVCTKDSIDALPCVGNPYFCADGEVPPCKCSVVQQACINICSGVTCDEGKVCVGVVSQDEAHGICQTIEDDCYATGCPNGGWCQDGQCEDHPCAGKECPEGEYCNPEGDCVSPCADIDCPNGCKDGACVDDKCAGVLCDSGFSCDSSTGTCAKGECWAVTCKYYEVCEDGECVGDPCWNLDCPNGMRCVGGSCYDHKDLSNADTDTDSETSTNDDTDDTDQGTSSSDSDDTETEDTDQSTSIDTTSSGEQDAQDEIRNILATGQGGCLCSQTPGANTSDRTSAGVTLGLLGLFSLLLLRRRVRSAIPIVTIITASTGFAMFGCQVEPFQYDEFGTTNTSEETDDTPTDTTNGGNTDTEDTQDTNTNFETDNGTDSCTPNALDADCDGVDNDCDGETDEDVDLETNTYNCGSCGYDCSAKYPHAFAVCEGGTCGMSDCAAYHFDMNNSDSDGCEYFCQPTVDPDANGDVCDGVDLGDSSNPYDGIDNDCDGDIDEDVSVTNDPKNCGGCGRICRYANGSPVCSAGACQLGDCNDSYWDLDNDPENGCEYSCEKTSEEEICNGKDDDCDGTTDEADDGSDFGAEGGDACYTSDDGGCNKSAPFDCRGLCTTGTWACESAELRCKDPIKPKSAESCNDIDDDCDGLTDEEEDIPLLGTNGALCGTSSGQCRQGHLRCALASVGAGSNSELCCSDLDQDGVCVPPTKPEAIETICDGLDNDCDGLIDESPTNPDQRITQGTCYYGQVFGDDPGTLHGACAAGSGAWTCYWGQWLCENAVGPVAETCNNVDDNCDGETDEGLYQDCKTQDYLDVGKCHGGLQRCSAGAWSTDCDGEILPSDEICDGLDNDCDGESDEEQDVATHDSRIGQSCGLGECAGVQTCRGGQVLCGEVDPLPEVPCNEKDDDCDGIVDELDTWVCSGCDGSGAINSECTEGVSAGLCQQGTWVCNASGEEPNCVGGIAPSAEICDGMDNDCDGLTDEDLTDVGEECGTGACATVTVCSDGREICDYSIQPGSQAEQCNGIDDNCDSLTDENLFQKCGGGAVGFENEGICQQGIQACDPATGEWSTDCQGEVPPSPDADDCDGLDNDCDGETDEEAVGGELCGPCDNGTMECIGGIMQCSGGTTPAAEVCDNIDNNCDGQTDEGLNQICGGCDPNVSGQEHCDPAFPSRGNCQQGIQICQNGSWQSCQGSVSPLDEVCDGLDNDCDGDTDDGLTEADAPAETCNSSCPPFETDTDFATYRATPVCDGSMGWMCDYHCGSGPVECDGSNNPSPTETICDDRDNNCDGRVDEGIYKDVDPSNCDGCGNNCSTNTSLWTSGVIPIHAVIGCFGGVCQIDSCDSGWWEDVDLAGADCLYECDQTNSGDEILDGLDNDCDGRTDEGLGSVEICDGLDNDLDGLTDAADEDMTPPQGTCRDRGECADVASVATCVNNAGSYSWDCNYDALASQVNQSAGVLVDNETGLCDGLDNDCDGTTDEDFSELGNPCHVGENGICRNDGVYRCNDGGNAIVCCDVSNTAAVCSGGNEINAGTEGVESCDGLDNDCDGTTDEGASVSYLNIEGTYDIFTYEASRPDSTTGDAGTGTTAACSKTNVLPWTDVTWTEAKAACQALNEAGCTDCWDLCTAEQWQHSCVHPTTCEAAIANFEGCNSGKWTLEGGWTMGAALSGDPIPNGTCLIGNQRGANYSDDADEEAYSDALDLSACTAEGASVSLRWRLSSNTETDWDYFYLFLRGNGHAWTQVYRDNGNNSSWREFTTDVTPYMGTDFQVSFLLTSDGSVVRSGAYIDEPELISETRHNYPYGFAFEPETCNGADRFATGSGNLNDYIIPTGDARVSNCTSEWNSSYVNDLSGNAEEWTSSSRTIGTGGSARTLYEIRGGSYNDVEEGLTCDFDFWAAEADFNMPNLGFRCCRGDNP